MKSNNSVLLVDNYDSFTFNLVQLINECDFKVVCIKNDQLDIDHCKQYKKIVISPGPGLPNEAGSLCTLIKELGPTHSILGVCLGHQAIAEVFGANLYQLAQPLHGKQSDITLQTTTDPLFFGLPSSFPVGRYHSWAVSRSALPPELKITATASDGVVMALSHVQYNVRGIQFHPESIMTPLGNQLIQNWLAIET